MSYVPPARVMMAILLILLLISSSDQAIARDTITPSQPLSDHETLISGDGTFALGFFSPGSSNKRYVGLWYNKHNERTIVWVANRENPVTNSSTGGVLSISNNGNLVITNQINSTVVWSSGMTNVSNPIAQLLNTGNLVVRDTDADDGIHYAWQGFDYPTDTMLAGMKVGVDFVTGLNRTLTAWTSDSNPSPSSYYVMMEVRGDPELVLCAGSEKVWRTGPWNGFRYSGVPAFLTYTGFNFSFINNKQEITYSYNTISSVLSKLTVNQSGALQQSLWVEDSGMWNVMWYAPMDQCDDMQVRPCGPFAVCNPNNSPVCDCIQGFTPKSGWDATGGCVRKTKLDCKNGTDGFIVISNTKLADGSNASVYKNLSLANCQTKCLTNCSCTAYAQADFGSGCIIWTSELTDLGVFTKDTYGQDLYVRLAAIDLDHKKKRLVLVIILSVTGSIVVLLPCVAILYLNCGKALAMLLKIGKKLTSPELSSNPGLPKLFDDAMMHGEGNKSCPRVSFTKIKATTENFSDSNKLGEGGFGPVYKGMLEGQTIAVKRLAKNSGQGIREFKNEITLIANLQHRNLVRLLGYCIEEEEKILIYEYLPNKSLDTYIFDTIRGAELDWQKRFHTIEGIAQGLLYLHKFSRVKVIHRDLKTSNILLDSEMNPKISDFGLARIFEQNENQANTRRVVGTYGYMSPEYAMEGLFSVKSDIYSFGVMLLEIVSGKKNTSFQPSDSTLNLLGYAWELWTEGRSLEFVDPILGDLYPLQEVSRCIHVALLCVQDHAADRPTISAVISMLHNETSLPFPKQPAFYVVRDEGSSSVKLEICTINNASFTSIHGR